MNKEEIIRELSIRSGYAKSNIKEVINILGDIITEEMASGKNEKIKFAKGFYLLGEVRPEHTMFNNIIKKEITIAEKIVPKVIFSSQFKELINDTFKKSKSQ